MPCSDQPVRTTAAGAWFAPGDGGVGSLVRVADGIPAGDVRRIRDLGLPGLLPIGNVVDERGQVWLRTPQPPGPTLGDLCSGRTAPPDAVAVLRRVVGVLGEMHARRLTHGALDADAVLLDADGAPLLVVVQAGPGDRSADLTATARLARRLAAGWCADDPEAAARLRSCADVVECGGLDAALVALADRVPAPRAPGDDVPRLRSPDDRGVDR